MVESRAEVERVGQKGRVLKDEKGTCMLGCVLVKDGSGRQKAIRRRRRTQCSAECTAVYCCRWRRPMYSHSSFTTITTRCRTSIVLTDRGEKMIEADVLPISSAPGDEA